MNSEIPRVTVIGALTPSAESVRAERLEYPNLEKVVNTHAPYEYQRMDEFWNAEDDSLTEEQAGRQLATQYMLMSALALNRSSDPELWSRRYTSASSEIYGLPDIELAKKLWAEQQLDSSAEVEVPFAEVAAKVGDFLRIRYAPAFETLDSFSKAESISPETIVVAFNAAISVLRQTEPGWEGWSAHRNEKIDSVRMDIDEKFVDVGMKRASVNPSQVKALFAHEVLVHALRSVNGSKISKELSTGLSGFQDAEEGLGVFVEYAVSGEISDKIIDRYVDIAYALGQIDGKKHTRKELVEHAMNRAIMRNEQADNQKSVEDITKEVYAHVNRIFRGSLGAGDVGIMTKDISYYKGFIDMGNYISAQLDEGGTIEDVWTFLTSGKFDPLSQKHNDYMNKISAEPVDI